MQKIGHVESSGKCCRVNVELTDPVESSVNKLCQGAFTPYIR